MRYLQPYSPDFNPIEMAFSKPKALLHAGAKQTISALPNAVGAVLPTLTPRKCPISSQQPNMNQISIKLL